MNYYRQGRINHWANRANARGLALLGASCLDIKTLLYWFFIFLGCSPCVKIVELIDNCVWYINSEELITLAFSVIEWLERVEPNSTARDDPRIRPKPVHPMDVGRNFSRVGQRSIFLILYRFLTMQCKWTLTKCFSLFTPLVCAGWTSILNRLSEMFSTLRLSEMFFFS